MLAKSKFDFKFFIFLIFNKVIEILETKQIISVTPNVSSVFKCFNRLLLIHIMEIQLVPTSRKDRSRN